MPKNANIICEGYLNTNGPSKFATPISSKRFFGLQLCFSVQVLYICLNLIDLSKIKVHFVYSKLTLRPKKFLLEISAANLEGLSI